MNLRILAAGAALITLLGSSAPVLSHTTVTGTTPGDGAVLEASPSVIEIRFQHAARLTSVMLHHAGEPQRRLEFTPAGSATEFELTDPRLGPGDNEIEWKALSGDGHVISGTLNYTVNSEPAGNN